MSTLSPSGAPSIHIEPGAHAPGGRTCVVRVHARNLADGPRQLTFTVLGLDGDWLPVPVRTGAVAADATVTVELEVPIAVGAVPGSYPFALAVEADVAPGTAGDVPAQRSGGPARSATTMVEGELRVDAPSTVMLGVEPAESEGVLGRSVHVVLSNSGDQPAVLRLDARPEKGLRISLDDERPRIPAHSTVRIPARLSMRPQIVGHRSRRTVNISAHGDQAPARFQAVYTSKPMVGSGAIRLIAMALVVVVWVTGVIITLPWLTDRLTGTEVVAAGQTVDGAGDGGGDGAGGEGSGGGPDGGSDGSGGEGSGEDGEAVDEGVRIGGVVGGSDPGGVRVRVAPASVLDRTEAGEAGEASEGAGGDGSGSGDATASAAASGSGGPVVHTAALARTVPADLDAGGAGLGKIPAAALGLVRTETVAAERTTSTQDDGTWAFAGMAPNVNYLITLSKPGYQTQRFVMSGTEAAATPLEVELVAGAGSMSGRITGPSGPVGGATVTLTDGTTTVTTSTSTTGDVGFWSVDGLSTPSTYLVTASGPGLGQQSALIDLDAGQTRSLDLRLFTGVASLAGTVTGPDSLGVVGGLGGITVTATDGTTTRTASTVTGNRAGTFVLAELPVPATYTVTFSGEGYASQTHEVELAQGSSAAVLDVLLDVSSGVVQGTVKDTAGLGLGGAGLTLTDGENTYKTMSTSDAEGSFRFNGITPGDYVLTAETFGHVNAYAPVTVERGGVATTDLVLTPISGDGLVSTSRIRGRVSDARTNGQITCPGIDPGEVCEVTVSMTAQAMDGSTRNISVTVAPDLEYTIPAPGDDGLLPGLYTLTVAAPGYESGEVKVQVPMGQTVVANQVALYPSPSIVGTILTRVGAVPADTCVIAMRDGVDPATVGDCVIGGTATEPTCTITGDARCAGVAVNGSYALERLSSGTYQVSVEPGGNEYVPVPAVAVSLAAGDVRRYDATMDRLGRVSFTVLADTGSGQLLPADGAEVTPVLIVGGVGTSLQSSTTQADGRVEFHGLQPGTYRFDADWVDTSSGTAVVLSESSDELTVGNNQELTSQVVLTRAQTGFLSRVVTNLGAGGSVGVPGVEVRVSGVIGYSGVVPLYGSAQVTTSTTGYFAVVPNVVDADEAWEVYLPLAGDSVDLAISDSRFEPYSGSGLRATDLDGTAVTLEPVGRQFDGSITFDGETAGSLVDRSDVEFRFELTPPGGTGATLSIASDGETLLWNDPMQPADGDGTLIRPGTYRVTATVDGYDSATTTFTVPIEPTAVTPVALELRRFGRLEVEVVADVGGQVLDPVITLTRPGQGNITTAAAPGTSSVDFGVMSSGTYSVRVQAAGYAFTTSAVTLSPNQSTPTTVTVAKLGTIRGTVEVLSANGTRKVLKDVLVRATDPVSGQEFTGVTNESGEYRITGSTTVQGLNAATWEVTTDVGGYSTWYAEHGGLGATYFPVVITGGEDEVQHITLTPEPVDLVVDLYDPATQDGINGLTVLLHTPTGTESPTCTPTGPPPAGAVPCDPVTDGRYRFADLEPGVYTLDVTGGGFAPLMVNVTVVAGAPTQVSIPIAARTNTIAGTVSGQAGASAPTPLEDATVELRNLDDSLAQAAVDTDELGGFTFANVPDGSYKLYADHDDFTATTRTLSVSGGQVASVDVVLFTEARQVTVTVSSTQGFDLTGALVSLVPAAGQLALAAQPAVRLSSTTYSTTFNQVPPGAWTASVSGPAGHYGTFTEAVGAGDDAVTISVDEVRLRLVATAADSGPPSTLEVTVEDSADAVVTTQSLGVNGGATVIYLARADYDVAATNPSGWTAAPATYTVDDADTDVTASFELTKVAVGTTTTLGVDPTSVVQGDDVDLTATVAATGPDPDAGTVTFYRDGGTELGTATVSNGSATLTVTTGATWSSSTSLTATFGGTSSFTASMSAAVNLTVNAPAANTTTTVTATPSSIVAGSGTAVTLSADVERVGTGADPNSGTVTFSIGVNDLGTGTWSGGEASLTVPGTDTDGWAEGTVTVTATFDGVSGTFNGSSDTVDITVTAPTP